MAHGTQENTFLYLLVYYKGYRASLVAQLVKNPPAMRETWIQSLGWEDPLEKGKATHCSILPWRIDCLVLGVAESDRTERLSHYKGYNAGTVRWKRCTGKNKGKDVEASMPSPCAPTHLTHWGDSPVWKLSRSPCWVFIEFHLQLSPHSIPGSWR